MRRPGRKLLLGAALAIVGCGEGTESTEPAAASVESDALSVLVVNEPLRTLASRVGGDRVEVVFPAPPEIDPANWSPDAATMAAYQGADLVLLNGAGYAGWLGRASLRRSALVDTSSDFEERLIAADTTLTHQHGPEGAHSHQEKATTLWLDLELAAEQARAVSAAFERARPAHAEGFRTRLATLEAELGELDARLERAATRLGGAPILFSHPVYDYFQRRYGLNGLALHWEPDVHPDADGWAEFDRLLAAHSARLILWEAEPLHETRRELEARGVSSMVFAPGGNRSADGEDWVAVMEANTARFEAAR